MLSFVAASDKLQKTHFKTALLLQPSQSKMLLFDFFGSIKKQQQQINEKERKKVEENNVTDCR